MHTSYLQYMVEIERTRSITQAAANLFLSQPNLSRILHEIEEQLGYAIFERSNRGVRPTEEGTAFLQHAKRILSEMEAIEVLRECHVRQALDYMAQGEIDLAIIRYRAEYQDYFRDQAHGRQFRFEALNGYRYRVIMHRDNPVAQKGRISVADLEGLPEITHGDTFRTRTGADGERRKRIYSVDRHAQLTLTTRIPGAFMWSTSVLPEDLAAWNLVQRDVEDNRVEYRNAVVSVAPELLNDIECRFLEFVRKRCRT